MLEFLRLTNFKAARELPLELRALTLLAGLNGSGKSTVLQSIALLKQSLKQGLPNPSLHLRGDLVQLGKCEDVWAESGDEELSFDLRYEGNEIRFSCLEATGKDVFPLSVEPDAATQFYETTFDGFQFIQADRLVPKTQYEQATAGDRETGWLGCRGEFAVDYLRIHGKDKTSPSRTFPKDALDVSEDLYKLVAPTDSLIDQVSGWLQQLSPGVTVSAEDIALTDEVSLRYQYTSDALGTEWRPRRPTHVGFGLTYCLPIVVACLAAKKGALLLLENPEAHLHPQGQSALGYLLALCAADGVQIIVETHSDHLLNGVRLAVKRQKVSANEVQLHNFKRPINTGECYAESPSILPDGQLSNWPTGFFDQWDRNLDALLD
jgi:predicted ATPase